MQRIATSLMMLAGLSFCDFSFGQESPSTLRNEFLNCVKTSFFSELMETPVSSEGEANTIAEKALDGCKTEQDAIFSVIYLGLPANLPLATQAVIALRLNAKREILSLWRQLPKP